MRESLNQSTALRSLLLACLRDDRRTQTLMRNALAGARWHDVARGPVGANTAVLDVRGGTLTVAVGNEAWRRRLERECSYFVEAFGPLPNGRPLARLRFVVAPEALRELPADTTGAATHGGVRRSTTVGKGRLTPGREKALSSWPAERLPELRSAFEAWVHAPARPPVVPDRDLEAPAARGG